jgi:4'-phosphopantetheinyl transferase EntD
VTDRAWAVDALDGGEELEGFVRLTGVLPSFARAVLAPLGAVSTSAYQGERDAMVAAGDRRRTEFFGGRACAHAAVRALGATDAPIGVGSGRQPLWPPGVVGSIAHGGSWCGAVAARAVDARGLGLDVEPVQPLPTEVERLVLTSEERRWMPASDSPAGFAAMVTFSAKECVYKSLFPTTGWALDFHDITVELDLARFEYRARLSDRFPCHGPSLEDLGGRFGVWGGHVFTVMCLSGSARA